MLPTKAALFTSLNPIRPRCHSSFVLPLETTVYSSSFTSKWKRRELNMTSAFNCRFTGSVDIQLQCSIWWVWITDSIIWMSLRILWSRLPSYFLQFEHYVKARLFKLWSFWVSWMSHGVNGTKRDAEMPDVQKAFSGSFHVRKCSAGPRNQWTARRMLKRWLRMEGDVWKMSRPFPYMSKTKDKMRKHRLPPRSSTRRDAESRRLL